MIRIAAYRCDSDCTADSCVCTRLRVCACVCVCEFVCVRVCEEQSTGSNLTIEIIVESNRFARAHTS